MPAKTATLTIEGFKPAQIKYQHHNDNVSIFSGFVTRAKGKKSISVVVQHWKDERGIVVLTNDHKGSTKHTQFTIEA